MPFDKYQEEVVKPQIRRRLDQLRKQYGQQKIVNADPEKMKLLVARLKDEDNETRIKSALALGDLGEKWKKFKVDESGRERVADALLRLLTTPAMAMGSGYWAARALGMLGEQRAVEPLMERLRKHPASVDLRTALVDALGELGDTRAVKVLELVVKSDCEKKNSWKKTVSECASRAIEKIKQQSRS